MGNAVRGGSSKEAKVMKIDGELFKLKTPAKVLDVIKDYPDHVLIDSDDFRRFSLRARPLDLRHHLMPKRLYLLVQLPKFPKTLRRARSGGAHDRTREVVKITRRSVSDLPIMTGSAEVMEYDGGGPMGRTRVKIRVRKSEVDRIMEESEGEGEVGERILRLCLPERCGDVVAPAAAEKREEMEEAAAERSCLNVYGLCSPVIYQRKYKRLSST